MTGEARLQQISRLAGIAGLAGALLTGIGEGLLQFAPGTSYVDRGYSYFLGVGTARLTLGHWLAVISAPLYLLGYRYLVNRLCLAPAIFRVGLYLVMAWGFVLATVWVGQRALLAEVVQAVSRGEAAPELIANLSVFHEPLINIMRGLLFVFSLIWTLQIARGAAAFPRWMALFSPVSLLATIFLAYAVAPSIGGIALPTALNTSHVIVFGLAVLFERSEAGS
jgi:hypothetical protein